MHIDDITAALAIRDIATIKEAFLVLANYPKGGDVTGLAAHNAMTFFEAAAQALRSDCTEMPDHGRKAFGMPQGASYADGAASVLTGRQMWSDHFAMIFRAHYPKPGNKSGPSAK